ncbi:DnaJ domain-containing protein [Cephalotus follicularis]|uniref:DnaJ domain-containing protein n=1 Tax=Cephalotus follicularis TaxID=3775 RepID=A0A1Q3AYI0_CEPFO|nr:DnaJ domain-containing protein [Cephalotus follicularis]
MGDDSATNDDLLLKAFFAEVSEVERDNEVLRILSCFKLNPYDYLNLPFDASPEDVKKQYRKLSLLVHPDKCKHPQAKEAFEALEKAQQLLLDQEERDYILSQVVAEKDWEVIADHVADELLPLQCLPGVSNLSLEALEATKVQAPKRHGRGTFSYKRDEMNSDRQFDNSIADDVCDEDVCHSSERTREWNYPKYGTRHVVVLADFSPSTRTTDLEKLFVDFTDRGVVIRWVDDTTALAVFPTPSIALEARNCVQCPFTVRILDEDDVLLSSISPRDLEPPRRRPKTSARTAQRLIAQGMGLKLPSTFGSRELKNQETDRRSRIAARQKLRDDAWGADDVN